MNMFTGAEADERFIEQVVKQRKTAMSILRSTSYDQQIEQARADLENADISKDDGIAPGTPTAVTLTPFMRGVAIGWDAPLKSDGVRVTRVEVTPTNGVVKTHTTRDVGITISSLDSGVLHSFRVQHEDFWGRVSAWTVPLTTTPEKTAAEYVDLASAEIAGELGYANIAQLTDSLKLADGVIVARSMASQNAALVNVWMQDAAIESAKIKEIVADKIRAGTLSVSISLTTGGSINVVGGGTISVGDAAKLSSAGLELRKAAESTSAAALIGSGISGLGLPGVRIWPIDTPNRRGWQMRSDGVAGSLPQGYTRLIATRGSSATSGDTNAWASIELNVDGNGPGYIAGSAGAIIQNMLWVVGPSRLAGNTDIAGKLSVTSGVDISAGDIRLTGASAQGLRSIGGTPLDLYAPASFIRINNPLLATSGLVVTGNSSLDGLSVSGNLTLPDFSISAGMLADSSVPTRVIRGNAVTSVELAGLAVGTAHIRRDAVTSTELADASVGEGKFMPYVRNGAWDTFSARTIASLLGGTVNSVASGNHAHGSSETMSFEVMRKEGRRNALSQRLLLRRRLKRYKNPENSAYRYLDASDSVSAEEYNKLLEFTLLMGSQVQTLSHLLMDAPDRDAFERERGLRDGSIDWDNIFFEYRHNEEAERRQCHIHEIDHVWAVNDHPDFAV